MRINPRAPNTRDIFQRENDDDRDVENTEGLLPARHGLEHRFGLQSHEKEAEDDEPDNAGIRDRET